LGVGKEFHLGLCERRSDRYVSYAMPRMRNMKFPDGSDHQVEVVGFRATGEHWNEYLMDDGSVVKLKPVVTEIVRVPDQYDGAGNPVYIVQSTNVLAVDAPEELRNGGA